MLILATKFSNLKTARAISWLCLYFPKASVNWWYEPRRFPIGALGIDNCRVDSAFTNDIYMLSPQLPFGVVGYHFPKVRVFKRTGRYIDTSKFCTETVICVLEEMVHGSRVGNDISTLYE